MTPEPKIPVVDMQANRRLVHQRFDSQAEFHLGMSIVPVEVSLAKAREMRDQLLSDLIAADPHARARCMEELRQLAALGPLPAEKPIAAATGHDASRAV